MEYTEEVKKEADSIVEKYDKIFFHHRYSYLAAIQNRLSVLEAIKKIDHDYNLSNEIQSLTQQIEYLQSKL